MDVLRTGATHFGIALSEAQVAQFARYQALLLDWNARMNLTAVREPAEIQERHFVDSLTCALVTGNLSGRSLIDVGTGAGFPGLPLKILYPQLQLTLVESVQKKTRFLHAVVDELGLQDVVILAERAEALGQDAAHRERYDWAVARAVAELRTLVEYLLPLCRLGGHALAQKGESAAAETAAARKAIHLLGGRDVQLTPVRLPNHPLDQFLVVIEKERTTPARYPRRPGMAAKRPL